MNIEKHTDLIARYGSKVPVVLLDQIEYFTGKVTKEALRRGIKKRDGEDL